MAKKDIPKKDTGTTASRHPAPAASSVSIKEAVAEHAGKRRPSPIQQAIDHAAGMRNHSPPIAPSHKTSQPAQGKGPFPHHSRVDSAYHKDSMADSKTAKNPTADPAPASRPEPSPPAPQALEDLTGPAPQNLENQTADIAAAYQRATNPIPDEPASFYANAGRPPGMDGEDLRMQGQGFREESNPLQSYANKDTYQHRTDVSTGQRLATMGNEELSLTGRIQKMYQMH